MPNVDPEPHLLAQDVIWVGGGSVVNLLAVWRAHGIDAILRRAWERGIVLGGVSAGAICWHLGGNTDSFGPELVPVTDGLGLLPFSTCVHYDGEPARRPHYHSLIADGTLPAGYATDDGVAIHYRGTEVEEVLSQTPGALAHRVFKSASGGVVEQTAHSATAPHRLRPHGSGDVAARAPGAAPGASAAAASSRRRTGVV